MKRVSLLLLLAFASECSAHEGGKNEPDGARIEKAGLPIRPDSLTWKVLERKEREWAVNRDVGLFAKCGAHSPEWDGAFKRFLADQSLNQYCMENGEDDETLYKKAQALEKLGCCDPYFLYLQAKFAKSACGSKEARPLTEKALQALEGSNYPPIYKFFACRRLEWIYNEQPQCTKLADETCRKKMLYFAQAAAQEEYKNGNQRYYMRDFNNIWSECSKVPKHGDLYMDELNKNPGVDPWIRLVAQGYYHVAKGWKARGGGFASSVTEDGWKIFKGELDQAAQCLKEAHALHPEYPEAACKMISVAMGSCGSGESERDWFDRAITAHCDYGDAYRAMLWALRPRWGGSHREMYEFGVECLNSGRFDTDVPMFFWTALEDIGSELEDWRDALRAPGTYEQLQKYFRGMIAEPTRVKNQACWKTSCGMTAWLTGHYGDAKKLFDELGTNLHAQVFNYQNCVLPEALAETRLACGPHGAQFCRAEALYQDGQSVEALPLYEALHEKMQGDPDMPVIEDRLAVLRLKSKMLGGEWVDLVPDRSLAGWSVLSGKWSLQEGGTVLQGVSTNKDDNLRIVSKLRFPPKYEIRGEADAQHKYGVILGYKPLTYATVHVNRHEKMVSYGQMLYKPEDFVREDGLARKTQFLIRVEDGRFSVTVNDKPYFTDESFGPYNWNPRSGQVGFGEFFGPYNGHVIKYSKLQARRLL